MLLGETGVDEGSESQRIYATRTSLECERVESAFPPVG